MERERGRAPLAIAPQQRRCTDGLSATVSMLYCIYAPTLQRRAQLSIDVTVSHQADEKCGAKMHAMIGCNPSVTGQLRFKLKL
jgi:hypothetical protein